MARYPLATDSVDELGELDEFDELERPIDEIPADLLRTTIRISDRVFFVGHTGSGKTHLAQQLLETIVPRRVPVVVIDPKKDFAPTPGHGWDVVSDLPWNWESITARRRKPQHLRLIIRPTFAQDYRKHSTLNQIYQRVFERKNALIYLDDVQRLTAQHMSSAEMAQLVQMGRSLRVSVWASTLRPSGIPRYYTSESDHVFVFRLRDDEDRKRVASVIGPVGRTHPGPGPFDFWYRPPGVDLLDPVLVHQ